jgi:hypothetical protein
MARTVFVPTTSYVLASSLAAVFTVQAVGQGQLIFNDVNTDDNAAHQIPRVEALGKRGIQVWTVIVDEG